MMQKNYNENLVAGAAIRDDKGRRISKLFEASHPKMTVGYAKNLIMPSDPEDQEFNFRQSGGGLIEDGVAVIDKVKGNSVVWNQLINSGNGGSLAGVTFTKNGLAYVLNGTCTAEQNFEVCRDLQVINGHKYCLASNSSVVSVTSWENPMVLNANKFFGDIATAMASGGTRIFIDLTNGTTYNNVVVLPVIYDLTQMFGAGNEPSTYEEFLSRKPKVADEYAYNEGTIVNNKVEKVKTTGINLWDEQWEVGSIKITTGEDSSEQDRIRMKGYLPVLPNTSYYCTLMSDDSTKRGYFCYYDQNKKHIAYSGKPSQYEMNRVFTTPSNCYFVRFYLNVEYGNTYNHDICINLSDPAINGQYFPYEKHELDLSWVKEIKDAEGVKLFEDGLRSAGTAFDEVRKNKAVKRFGVKVFDGTENFIGNYLAEYGSFVIMSNAFVGVGSSIGISNRYVVSSLWSSDPDRTKDDKQIYIDSINNRIWIRDSAFADVDSLKQYLADLYAQGNPLTVIYELAEPIEVEYDEKNLTYPVVVGGTEEAIASEPSTAFRADIGYGIDAVKTILDLKARVEALEAK